MSSVTTNLTAMTSHKSANIRFTEMGTHLARQSAVTLRAAALLHQASCTQAAVDALSGFHHEVSYVHAGVVVVATD